MKRVLPLSPLRPHECMYGGHRLATRSREHNRSDELEAAMPPTPSPLPTPPHISFFSLA